MRRLLPGHGQRRAGLFFFIRIPADAAEGYVAENNVFHHSRLSRTFPVVIVPHTFNRQARKAAMLHGYVPDKAAALWRGLEMESVFTGGKVTVPDPHIINSAGQLASDCNPVSFD